MPDKSEIINFLKSNLSEKRFYHSMMVAKKAVELAKIYGADETKAELAGLTHDVAKEESPKLLLQELKQSGIIGDSDDLISNNVLHQMIAPARLKEIFKINDIEILNAAKYHTTGHSKMSLLDKILYVADCVSEDREYDNVESLRKLASENLDMALLECLIFVIQDLSSKHRLIHPYTIDAYNAQIKLLKD